MKRISEWAYLRAFFSPFIRPKLRMYIGTIKHGTPYFFPRNWRKFNKADCIKKAIEETNNPRHIFYGLVPEDIWEKYKGYSKAVPKKIGFDFVSLGWKTKWTDIDYRHEWSPMWSFVFFKWQICLFFIVPEPTHYWASWLYYMRNTNATNSPEERIKECKEGFPNIWKRWTNGQEELIDYYKVILKKKYVN